MGKPSTITGPSRDFLEWPFFTENHKMLAQGLDAFAVSGALSDIDHAETDKACRALVRALGDAGLLDAATGAGGKEPIDSRSVCLTRETLAWHDGLADFAFAMQGLGTGAIGLAGSEELRTAILPRPVPASGSPPSPCRRRMQAPMSRP